MGKRVSPKTMSPTIIFLDGHMIPARKSLIESLTPGILIGRGVFETMKASTGKIFALPEHLNRLMRGLCVLGIKPPCSRKRLRDCLDCSLQVNKLKSAMVRLTVWQENRRTRVAVIVRPYQPWPREKYVEGFKARVSYLERRESLKVSNIKSLNYRPFLMAYKEAVGKGNDEAIFFNRQDELIEGSRSNLFFIKGGTLCTPSLVCGCLKGVTRQIVIKIARELGIRVKCVKAKLEALLHADEAFLTNSLMEVMPLTWVQGQPVGKGAAGPMTKHIRKEYGRLTQWRV